mmetsp:Transcript_22635/g.47022  ORF Transcript_22635/g.47022 Transcript_22635/m.47022 type:complete len:327 (+) Transcript_22635:128-1108(+)
MKSYSLHPHNRLLLRLLLRLLHLLRLLFLLARLKLASRPVEVLYHRRVVRGRISFRSVLKHWQLSSLQPLRLQLLLRLDFISEHLVMTYVVNLHFVPHFAGRTTSTEGGVKLGLTELVKQLLLDDRYSRFQFEKLRGNDWFTRRVRLSVSGLHLHRLLLVLVFIRRIAPHILVNSFLHEMVETLKESFCVSIVDIIPPLFVLCFELLPKHLGSRVGLVEPAPEADVKRSKREIFSTASAALVSLPLCTIVNTPIRHQNNEDDKVKCYFIRLFRRGGPHNDSLVYQILIIASLVDTQIKNVVFLVNFDFTVMNHAPEIDAVIHLLNM